MKISLKNKTVLIEILVLLIIFIITVMSLLADFSYIDIPNFLVLNVTDVEGLLFTLFTVQASVATISIAVVSIVTSILDDTVCGISVTRYITNLRPVIFKHHTLIIVSLCIIPINYFCVSWALFNLSIALFILSIVINIKLVNNVSVVFHGKEKIRNNILDFLSVNYSSDYIITLTEETMAAIEVGNSLKIKENYEAYKLIFTQEVLRTNYNESEIITQLSHTFSDILSKIVRMHDPRQSNECILFICEIYDIANENSNKPLYLKLWEEIISDYLVVLKELSYEQLCDSCLFILLRNKLYDNIRGLTAEQQKESRIKYYSSEIYHALFEKKDRFSKEEKEKILINVYNHVAASIDYSDEKNMIIRRLYMYEMCYLHKIIIEEGDCNELTELYFKYISYSRNNNSENDIIYLVTLIYLYYLSSREPMLNESPLQTKALNILAENKFGISYFYFNVDIINIIAHEYLSIQALMRNWEYSNSRDWKVMIIHDVVFDFFVFTLLNSCWKIEKLSDSIKTMFPTGLFSIYSRYFEDEETTVLKENYKIYNDLFSQELTENDRIENVQLLHDVVSVLYKNEALEDAEKNAATPQIIESTKRIIADKIVSVIEEDIIHFKNHHDIPNTEEIEKQNVMILQGTLPVEFLSTDKYDNRILDSIHSAIISYFLRTISSHIDLETVNYKSKTKQELLIKKVQQLGIKGDVVIGNRDRHWNEDNQTLLKDFTDDMVKIRYPRGANSYYILDSSLIEFSLENIRVEFKDLLWEEIDKKESKDNTGKFLYNITNNIFLPFEKAELQRYMECRYKKFIVTADVKYRFHKDKVGAGIRIVTE